MEGFLKDLAAPTATPGGGAAACYAAAMAVSLGEMVLGLAAKKDQGDPPLQRRLGERREAFLQKAEEDAKSFELVLVAYRLPKDDPSRPEAIADGLRGAALVPLSALDLMAEAARDLLEAKAHCPKSAISDWEASLVLLRAAYEVGRKNVVVNLDGAREKDALARRLEALDKTFYTLLPEGA